MRCPECRQSCPSGDLFCSDCGAQLAGPGRTNSRWLVSPSGGIQAFAGPDAHAAPSVVIPAGTALRAQQSVGPWLQVRDQDRTLGWVDGRALRPRSSAPASPTSSIDVPTAVVAFAGAGVIIGALLDWSSYVTSSNAFNVSAPFLFDHTSTDPNPKLGIFLIVFGGIAIASAFIPNGVWIRRICGALSLGAALLYVAQWDNVLRNTGTDVTDVLGVGVWVTGICGAILLVTPPGRPWPIGSLARPASRPDKGVLTCMRCGAEFTSVYRGSHCDECGGHLTRADGTIVPALSGAHGASDSDDSATTRPRDAAECARSTSLPNEPNPRNVCLGCGSTVVDDAQQRFCLDCGMSLARSTSTQSARDETASFEDAGPRAESREPGPAGPSRLEDDRTQPVITSQALGWPSTTEAPEPASEVDGYRACVPCGASWPADSIFCGDCGSRFDAPDDRPANWADVDAIGWVDGRQLIPPITQATSTIATPPTRTQLRLGEGQTSNEVTRNVIAALASAGILLGVVLDWLSVGPSNAFHVPFSSLFDYSNASPDPKLAYFVLAFGLVGLIFSSVEGAGVIRALCGGLALGAAILFVASVGHDLPSSVSVTDLIGPGPWITGISGLILLISPAFYRNRSAALNRLT